MWLVRLRMRVPRPLARAMKRFSVGPSSTMMVLTFSSSTSAPWLCSALAIADSTTFLIRWAAFLSENFSRLTARSADRPRTWSATRRAFCGEMRALRRIAFASFWLDMVVISLPRLLVAAMTLEVPGQFELAELVARSEEHTSELQSLMRRSYAVFRLKQNRPIPSAHRPYKSKSTDH